MRCLIACILLLFTVSAVAQSPLYGTVSTRQYMRMADETSALMTDAMGQPFYPQQKYNWEGKVFFPENYTMATVTSMAGKVYRNIRAKFNLLDNTLLFTDSADREFVVTIPIEKVEFEDTLFSAKTVFFKPKGDTGAVMYQVLDSGKISLLKKIYITYKDQMAYGSTMVTRIFEQKYTYLSYRNTTLAPLERSKPAVMELMSDQNSKVGSYIESEKLKIRKEEDLIKVFRFYNSL